MSKVLIDRELLERVQERLDPHRDAVLWGEVCDTFRATPSGTPAMPVKAYYHEWTDLEGVRTRSVGLEVRKEFTDAPLVLEADALARIACLEGEIAKRDEVIVGLTNSRDFWREKAIAADDELAAIKAQEPVAWAGAIEDCASLFVTEPQLWKATPLYAAPVSEAKAQGSMLQKIGKRLAELLDEDQFAEVEQMLARLNAAHVQQVSVPDGFCIGAWRDALEKIAKYAPQVNCAARTELERAGLIAVHALIAFSAPQFRHARGTQTASNAAPAAPAADAGHVFYGMDGNHP